MLLLWPCRAGLWLAELARVPSARGCEREELEPKASRMAAGKRGCGDSLACTTMEWRLTLLCHVHAPHPWVT